jgi:hypothetical protein
MKRIRGGETRASENGTRDEGLGIRGGYLPNDFRVEMGMPWPRGVPGTFRVPYRVRETWAPNSITAEEI